MSAVGSLFLLAWRLHRWELAAIAVASAGLGVAAFGVAGELGRQLAECRAAAILAPPCGMLEQAGMVYHPPTQTVMYLAIQALAVLPFAAGVVLGVPLLARELEHGTAQLTWPLAGSRGRWLWTKLWPATLLGLVLLAIPAVAGEALAAALRPVLEPGASFEEYGARGPLLVIRFLPALAVAALTGALLRRQLPALLVASLLAAAIGVGLSQIRPLWLEPVEQPEVFEPIETMGTLYVHTRYRDRDGSWLAEEEAFARMSWDGEGEEPDWTQMPESVMYVLPGERYPEVVLRESALLVATAMAIAGLLALRVGRMRPG